LKSSDGGLMCLDDPYPLPFFFPGPLSTKFWYRIKLKHYTIPGTSPTVGLEMFMLLKSLVFCVMFYRTLFVLLSFFFWPLYCLSFFDLRLLFTHFRIKLWLWYLQTLLIRSSRGTRYWRCFWKYCTQNIRINLNFLCFTPLSAIFQLYHGDQF